MADVSHWKANMCLLVSYIDIDIVFIFLFM